MYKGDCYNLFSPEIEAVGLELPHDSVVLIQLMCPPLVVF